MRMRRVTRPAARGCQTQDGMPPGLLPHPTLPSLPKHPVLAPDDEIIRKVQANIAECEPAFREAKVGGGRKGCGGVRRCWRCRVKQAPSLAKHEALAGGHGNSNLQHSPRAGTGCCGRCQSLPLSPSPPQVVDAAVLRFPRAVTHFSPGSAKWRPTQVSWKFPKVVVLRMSWCTHPAMSCMCMPALEEPRLPIKLSSCSPLRGVRCRRPALATWCWRATGSRGCSTAPTACRRQAASYSAAVACRVPPMLGA